MNDVGPPVVSVGAFTENETVNDSAGRSRFAVPGIAVILKPSRSLSGIGAFHCFPSGGVTTYGPEISENLKLWSPESKVNDEIV